jgi:hypothetical protein
MATMIAQVPALLESLTGVELAELIKKVPELGTFNGQAKTAPVTATPKENGLKSDA